MDSNAPRINTTNFTIAMVSACNRPQDRDTTPSTAGQATHDNPIGKLPEALPAGPELMCSKCDFQNDSPERLAEHLITVHVPT
jgi:hypothetical protein